MVESNNGEERLARIEAMVEALQRESAALKSVAAKLIDVVVQAAPTLAADPAQRIPSKGKHARRR